MDIVKEFFERRAGIAGFPVRRSARREKDELAAELGALRAELARVAEEKAPAGCRRELLNCTCYVCI